MGVALYRTILKNTSSLHYKSMTYWKCWLGHRFMWTRLVETETSKALRTSGLKTVDLPHDFIHETYNTDLCSKCGLSKQELGITTN